MEHTIEDIIEGVASGAYSKDQAVKWLREHFEYQNRLDFFIGCALTSILNNVDLGKPMYPTDYYTKIAYDLGKTMISTINSRDNRMN